MNIFARHPDERPWQRFADLACVLLFFAGAVLFAAVVLR